MIRRVALVGLLLAGVGCGLGQQSGVAPPMDRVFFPAALTVDPTSRWLYVVNANSDLRYNGGTLVALDLDRVAAERAPAAAVSVPSCGPAGQVPVIPPGATCCRDALDAHVINCDDRSLVESQATVQIGSYGAAIAAQPWRRGDQDVQRLFLAVRSDPSITFVDATLTSDGPRFRCTGPRPAPGDAPAQDLHASCDDHWRIKASGHDASLTLPSEPYALALDPGLGTLYVGHLLGGQVSLIDVREPCKTTMPDLVSVNANLLNPDGNGHRGITSLLVQAPGDPNGPIWATSRFAPSAIASFVVRGASAAGDGACDSGVPDDGARDMAAVAAEPFFTTTFAPVGQDIRGLAFSPDGLRAYVLHRSPSAVMVLDRTPDAYQHPANNEIGVVEVCAGPTAMASHDTGCSGATCRGPRLFVTCFDSGEIYVVDPELLALSAVIEVGRGPAALAFAPADPTVGYVAGFSDNNLSVIDLRPGSPTEYRVAQRVGIASATPRDD